VLACSTLENKAGDFESQACINYCMKLNNGSSHLHWLTGHKNFFFPYIHTVNQLSATLDGKSNKAS
jgi:hypothetical protein